MFANYMNKMKSGYASGMNYARNMSPSLKSTLAGAGAGAVMGGASSDSTGLGMLGGGLMGAAAGRYGHRGFSAASGSGRGILGLGAATRAYGQAFGKGVARQAMSDYKGTKLAGNQAINSFRGLKGMMGFGSYGGGI